MDRDQIHEIYDSWYAESYDERFLSGGPWNDNLFAYQLEVIGELLPAGGRWLDVACGTGKHLASFPDVDREGFDLSPAMVARARDRNPGVEIEEGSFLDEQGERVGRYDLVTNFWLAYQLVDTLNDVERAVQNMASWVSPEGSLLIHVGDAEDLTRGAEAHSARGIELPWEATVVEESLYITSVTWTWREANGRTHQDLVAPQLQRMVNIVARDFEEVEVRRWPAIDDVSGRPKAVIGRKKRAVRLSAAEVGVTYPYELVYPPRDHPLEKDPSRPGDPGFGAEGAAPTGTAAPEPDPRIDAVLEDVASLRSELSSLAEALLPVVNSQAEAAARREGTLGVVHDQTWAIRKDISDFYGAWDARSTPQAPPTPPAPRLDRVGTKRLAAELARRLNPFKRQFWARSR